MEKLVALLPADVTSFKKSFLTTKEQVNGSSQLLFADDTTALASLVSYDGNRSKVRELVCNP